MAKMANVALVGIFAASMLSAPAALAENGTTAKGGDTSGNAASGGTKADKKMQTNAMSADKKKQHK